jgi:CheY-like chemotaxis protein
METSENRPLRPGAWCRLVASWLPEQAGIVRDAEVLAVLLDQLAAQDPPADAFAAVLAAHQQDPRSRVAEAARRIQWAWELDCAAAAGQLAADRPRAVVVDDEPPVCEIVADVLKRRFAVTTATSGEEALATARAARPSLIVLDVMMPGMNGYEVARQLRADPATADIPVLFCTAQGGLDARLVGRELGAAGYIVKPFELHRLAAQASAIVGLDPLGA